MLLCIVVACLVRSAHFARPVRLPGSQSDRPVAGTSPRMALDSAAKIGVGSNALPSSAQVQGPSRMRHHHSHTWEQSEKPRGSKRPFSVVPVVGSTMTTNGENTFNQTRLGAEDTIDDPASASFKLHHQLGRRGLSVAARVLLKICLVFSQTLALLPSSFHTFNLLNDCSYQGRTLASNLIAWIFLDTSHLHVGANCLATDGAVHRVTHHHVLLLTTLAPLCLLGVAWGSARLTTWSLRKRRASSTAPCHFIGFCLIVVFVALPICAKAIFTTFSCETLDGGETYYLTLDYQVRCDTAQHRWMLAYGCLMVLVWPVGVPLAFITLIQRHRRELRITGLRDISPNMVAQARISGVHASRLKSQVADEATSQTTLQALLLERFSDSLLASLSATTDSTLPDWVCTVVDDLDADDGFVSVHAFLRACKEVALQGSPDPDVGERMALITEGADAELLKRALCRTKSHYVCYDDIFQALPLPRHLNPRLAGLRILYEAYNPRSMFWEVLVTARRVLVIGVCVAADRQGARQTDGLVPLLAGLVLLGDMLLQASWRPFEAHVPHLLSMGASMSTLLVLLSAAVGLPDGHAGPGISPGTGGPTCASAHAAAAFATAVVVCVAVAGGAVLVGLWGRVTPPRQYDRSGRGMGDAERPYHEQGICDDEAVEQGTEEDASGDDFDESTISSRESWYEEGLARKPDVPNTRGQETTHGRTPTQSNSGVNQKSNRQLIWDLSGGEVASGTGVKTDARPLKQERHTPSRRHGPGHNWSQLPERQLAAHEGYESHNLAGDSGLQEQARSATAEKVEPQSSQAEARPEVRSAVHRVTPTPPRLPQEERGAGPMQKESKSQTGEQEIQGSSLEATRPEELVTLSSSSPDRPPSTLQIGEEGTTSPQVQNPGGVFQWLMFPAKLRFAMQADTQTPERALPPARRTTEMQEVSSAISVRDDDEESGYSSDFPSSA